MENNMKIMISRMLGFIILICLVGYANSFAVSLSPELVEKLRSEGRLGEWVEKANSARSKGVWQPNPNPPVVGIYKGVPALAESLQAIALLVDFVDNVHSKDTSQFSSLLFSLGTYPTGSMRDYYWENSYQQFDLNGAVSGWIRAPESYAYYVDGQYGFGYYPQNAQGLVEDVVIAADPYVNFANFDKDGDGWVDGLFIVHAGPGAEQTGNPNDIWSHSWSTTYVMWVDGVRIFRYAMQPEETAGGGLVTMGVYCHEFGHVLGLPDLYDTDYSSEGLGDWSLMAGGSWNDGGRTPAHFDAWSKSKLGFIQVDTVRTNLYGVQILQIETSPKAYRLWTEGQTGSQYFLVENRQQTLFDTFLVEGGLLIYHVDETMSSNTREWCPGYPASPHYKVALEQSDGRFNLEGCYGYPLNSGDRGDPFPGYFGKVAFDSTTIPSSRNYNNNSTQVAVGNISYSDSVMYADLLVMPFFIRGDANGNGTVDLGDIAYLVNYLYKNGPAPQPLLAGDANSDGVVNLGDVVYLITYLYKGGPPPSS